jgi:hypothetical protein
VLVVPPPPPPRTTWGRLLRRWKGRTTTSSQRLLRARSLSLSLHAMITFLSTAAERSAAFVLRLLPSKVKEWEQMAKAFELQQSTISGGSPLSAVFCFSSIPSLFNSFFHSCFQSVPLNIWRSGIYRPACDIGDTTTLRCETTHETDCGNRRWTQRRRDTQHSTSTHFFGVGSHNYFFSLIAHSYYSEHR